MLPDTRPRHALLLGLGGGTIAGLLVRRFGPLPITAVEKNPLVVELARQEFELPTRDFTLVVGDAFDFVFEAEGPFDYVAVDLFENGGIPGKIFSHPFLRRLKTISTASGLVAINFFKDRRASNHLRRLEQVFSRVQTLTSGKNLIALCRSH